VTLVQFYTMVDEDPESRWRLAGKLIERANHLGHTTFIQVKDAQDADSLSRALWGFKPESFLAHGFIGKGVPERVQIGWGTDHGDHHDVLLQLSDSIPEFFSRFNKVIEMTCQHPELLNTSRMHYRYYQDRGYKIKHIPLKTSMS